MRSAILFVGLLLAAAGSVNAQSPDVRRGPIPAWATVSDMLATPSAASGPVFMRRQDAELHLEDQGQAQFLSYRVKILQPAALQFGNITMAWRPPAASPVVHEIKIYRGGDVIDALKDAKFEVLRREDQLEAAQLDGTLTAVLHVPDLRVGDELEVAITSFDDTPLLRPHASGLLGVIPAPPPGRYHIGLSWSPSHALRMRMTPDIEGAAIASDHGLDVRLDNPPVVTPPADAPPRYGWRRVIQYSDYPDWAAMSRQFDPIFDKAAVLQADSPLKVEARHIAAENATPLQRANAALKLVQQNVRYIFVGLNGGAYMPTSADETWRRRYGDCKAKTVLLLALLKELGVKAQAVLVNASGADDGLDQRLPLVEAFDHVLVRADLDGARYWMDGTLPAVATASPTPVLPLRWVLPLTAAGSPLEALPWRPAQTPDAVTLFEADARAGFDAPAKIKTTQITRGVAGLQQQVAFSAVSADQLREIVRQNGMGETFQTIDDVNWKYDEAARASILTITGSGKIDWENDGGGARSLALPGGGFNPPEKRQRLPGADPATPYYQKPEYSCHATTVRLPASTMGAGWNSKPSFDQSYFGADYHRAFELRDGAIRMVRGFRVEAPEITTATAQRDDARIPSFDNSMGYIFYDPKLKKNAVGRGEHVPSTSEIDWTAASVPCLGPSNPG